MTKTFCDKCHTQIGHYIGTGIQKRSVSKIDVSPIRTFIMGSNKEYLLCKDCYHIIFSFLHEFFR